MRRLTITCNCSMGLMRCASCHKPIEVDEQGFARIPFAYYETSEAYVTFHRSCTESNPAWAKYDEDSAVREKHEREFKAACKAFRMRWDIDDLDHYIDD